MPRQLYLPLEKDDITASYILSEQLQNRTISHVYMTDTLGYPGECYGTMVIVFTDGSNFVITEKGYEGWIGYKLEESAE